MNFFTKPITYVDMQQVCCSEYQPGTYNSTSSTGTFLKILKLEYENKNIVHLDPIKFISAIFCNDGWQEGWDLIAAEMMLFLQNNGPTQGKEISLDTLENRKKVFSILLANKLFIRRELRLKMVEVIEGLK